MRCLYGVINLLAYTNYIVKAGQQRLKKNTMSMSFYVCKMKIKHPIVTLYGLQIACIRD